MTAFDSLCHLGVPVHHRDLADALAIIDGFIADGRATGRSHQIVTVNTDFLVNASRYEDVHEILRTADLAIADGMPLVWFSAAMGQRLPGRIAGADLVPALAARAATEGYRLMFFGGAPGVADQAAEVLRTANPGLIVGTADAMVSADGDTDPEVLDRIREFRPDVICVALGHPKQERWIRRHAAELGIPVGIGVGGTFDFLAGERRRASPWLQRFGLEWAHRLVQEPHRLTRRYVAVIGVYVPSMMHQVAHTRLTLRRRPASDIRIEVVYADADVVVAALRRNARLDHVTVAELSSLVTEARREGREIHVVGGPRSQRSLRRLRLDRSVRIVPHPRPSTVRSRYGPARSTFREPATVAWALPTTEIDSESATG